MSVRHANPVTAAGYAVLPTAILLRRDLSPQAKLLYAYLSHLAWRNDGAAEQTLDEMAEALNVSKRALQGYMSELRRQPVEEGDWGEGAMRLVEAERFGLGQPNGYVLNDPVISEDSEWHVAATQSGTCLPDTPIVEVVKAKNNPPLVPPEIKIGKSKVTTEERATAGRILEVINEVSGCRYRASKFIAMIARRMREHPELTFEDHERVVRSTWAKPRWWERNNPGDPGAPNVAYGNETLFEHRLAVSKAEQPLGLYAQLDEWARASIGDVVEGEATEIQELEP